MVKCIVVDDDKDIADVFSEMLELQGMKILGTGQNGEDAVTLLEKYTPDLVFLDVHMPKKNGLEALKEIKTMSRNSKVVMVTGDLSKDLEKKLQDNGASAIIFKPFKMDKIMEILEEIQSSVETITQHR